MGMGIFQNTPAGDNMVGDCCHFWVCVGFTTLISDTI